MGEYNENISQNDEFEENTVFSFGEDTAVILAQDEMTEDNEDSGEKPTKFAAEFFDWLEVLVTAMIAVIVIFSFIFRVATIDGESMLPTFYPQEKVIITNLAYEPKPGDVVVISRNNSNSVNNISDLPIIKRIIAVEGQTVDIDFIKGEVYVDGVKENYVNVPTNLKYDIEFPVTVDKGCIFVLGDNRNDSLDSRSSSIGKEGMIDTRYVLGHAIFRVFPFNKIGGID